MSIFFIAEIGINHNGDIDLAKKLIDVASKSGCDAVKFQKRDIDLVYTQDFLNSARQSPWGTTQRDQKRGLEFDFEDYQEIDKFCAERKINWFASAWDLNSQKFLSQFDTRYNKIASAMIVCGDLLEVVASEMKHTFISTGMSSLDDIDKAVNIFERVGCPFELMHTVSTYPMRDQDANLKCIATLRDRYKCPVGYSGHETGVAISVAAAALGASSIERHITIDRAMYGSDQAASLEPAGLANLVGSIRKIPDALGDGVKKITADELDVAAKLRQHL
jgi:N-acetylneuraminate synthase